MYRVRELFCNRGVGDDVYQVHLPQLDIGSGETIAITGSSGSGKSTILEMLGLVLRPSQCQQFVWQDRQQDYNIELLWQTKAEAALGRLRAQRIGFVLQSGGLLPYLSVEANLGLPRRIAAMPQDDDWLESLIMALKLDHLRKKFPHQLSVGERQRVSIARAMAHQPDLLLADEPTAALDPQLADQVMDLMLGLVANSGSSAIIVSHDYQWLRGKVDRELQGQPYLKNGLRGCRFE